MSRYAVGLPTGHNPGRVFGSNVAVSPDGSALVYVGPLVGDTTGQQLWLRKRDQLDPQAIPGTETAFSPAFSPDGTRVAFLSGSGPYEVKIASLGGEPPITVTTTDVGGGGADGARLGRRTDRRAAGPCHRRGG